MSERSGTPFEREVRDTIVKSGLTGVAMTAAVVTIFSPAGLGGMIGTSLASNFGFGSGSEAADDVYANLPAYPAPLTVSELSDIRGQLASTSASLEITRAATEAKIERVRSIADTRGFVTYDDAPVTVPSLEVIAPTAPVSLASIAPVEPIAATPVNYTPGGAADPSTYRDPHLELADLLLAHENF